MSSSFHEKYLEMLPPLWSHQFLLFLCFLLVSERKVNFKATTSKRNRFVPAFLPRERVMGKKKCVGYNSISTISKEEFIVEFCIVNTFRFYILHINYQLFSFILCPFVQRMYYLTCECEILIPKHFRVQYDIRNIW